MSSGIETVREIGKKIQLLHHIDALLGWDQEVYMPPRGIEERSEQLSCIQGELHDLSTSDELGKALAAAGASEDRPAGNSGLSEPDAAAVRILFKQFNRQIKLPKSLVTTFAKETSISQHRWVEARKQNDFSLFEPHLARLVDLTAEKIEKIGYSDHPYDVLLDEFEPGAKTEEVRAIFTPLAEGIKALLGKISAANQVDASFLSRAYPVEKQKEFGRTVLETIGYDFNRGRLDESAHPFTTTIGGDDVRVTTRYLEKFFNSGLFGIIHEAGHGMYEQGFDNSLKGTILADGTSLGIHESQSRMWENMIGRGRPFWDRYYRDLQKMFPENLADVDQEDFYRGINKAEPSFIRVEADEVTYNLHIILRFELELALVTGKLKPSCLPEAWNQRSAELFGITPPTESEGVLQDIHWSMGAFGYFPTYTLGNLYSAQFFFTMLDERKDTEEEIRRGDFSGILSWLRKKIHRYGSIYPGTELCKMVTGAPLDPGRFLTYINGKYNDIYQL